MKKNKGFEVYIGIFGGTEQGIVYFHKLVLKRYFRELTIGSQIVHFVKSNDF